MKYSDVPMPHKEGEYPWEQVAVFDQETKKFVLKYRQLEEADIQKEHEESLIDGMERETDKYYIQGKDEFYDYVTTCKICGTDFIAYKNSCSRTRKYCPGCGERLIPEETEQNKE